MEYIGQKIWNILCKKYGIFWVKLLNILGINYGIYRAKWIYRAKTGIWYGIYWAKIMGYIGQNQGDILGKTIKYIGQNYRIYSAKL